LNVGLILAHYRKKSGLTQEELGEGICSVTHISKIERGLTEVSNDTVQILGQRLCININEEIEKLNKNNSDLKAISLHLEYQNYNEAKVLLDSINYEDFRYIDEIYVQYLLIKARYLIVNNEITKAKKILRQKNVLNSLEMQFLKDMYIHIDALLDLKLANYTTALDKMLKLNLNPPYSNEVYYHLSYAAYFSNQFLLSFQYALNAKTYYQSRNNFAKVIDCEFILLSNLEEESDFSFDLIEYKYLDLIKLIDRFKLEHKKASIYHNLGYQYYKNGRFLEAINYYNKSLELDTDANLNPLTSYYGLARCTVESNLFEYSYCEELINKGIKLSKKWNDEKYKLYFNLLNLKYSRDHKMYFAEIEQNLVKLSNSCPINDFRKNFLFPLINYIVVNNQSGRLLNLMMNYKHLINKEL
jgi:transcriptional regulator with XRE-family HTH domain